MLLSPNSPEAAAFHYRLSVAFLHRADRHELEGLDTCADFNRAVDAARRAADAATPDSPLVPGWLDGLAGALRARWEATGSEQDLREASGLFRRAAEEGLQQIPPRPCEQRSRGSLGNLAEHLE